MWGKCAILLKYYLWSLNKYIYFFENSTVKTGGRKDKKAAECRGLFFLNISVTNSIWSYNHQNIFRFLFWFWKKGNVKNKKSDTCIKSADTSFINSWWMIFWEKPVSARQKYGKKHNGWELNLHYTQNILLKRNNGSYNFLKLSFLQLMNFTFYYFLLPISRESIVLGSNFRSGDFDGFTRFDVSWIRKSHF